MRRWCVMCKGGAYSAGPLRTAAPNRIRTTEREYGEAYSLVSRRFAPAGRSIRRVVSDTLALHPSRTLGPHGTQKPIVPAPRSASMAKPTRLLRGDSHPLGGQSGEWSATHSRSTHRTRWNLTARRSSLFPHHGARVWRSLLACFAVIRSRWAVNQASGLRHTRAPPIAHAGTSEPGSVHRHPAQR